MSTKWMKLALTPLLAGTLLLAQAPPAHGGRMAGHSAANRLEMLTTVLNLTDAQQAQAKSIFDSAHQQAQPLRDQLRQGHQSLADAVKAGKSDVEIDQLAAHQGALMGQMTGIVTKGLAKFYAILTPDQQQKADKLHGQFMGMFQQHRFGRAM